MRTFRLIPWLLLAALATPTLAAPDEFETRTEDISDLVHPGTSRLGNGRAGVVLFTVPGSGETTEDSIDVESGWVERWLSTSDVENILSAFASEADEEWGDVSVAGNRVTVTGNAEAQRRVSGALAVLRRAMREPIRLTADVLHVPSGTPVPAMPSEADVGRLRAADPSGGDTLSFRLDGGRWQLASSVQAVRIVADVDVEIAQEAQIADPVNHVFEEGSRVFLNAAPLSDGRAAVRVVASSGMLRNPIRHLALGPEELGALELPELEGSVVVTEMLLTQGRPQAIALSRPGGDVDVFVLRLDAPAYVATGGTFRLVPTGALIDPESSRLLVLSEDGPYGDGEPWISLSAEESRETSRLSEDLPREIVSTGLETEIDEGTCTVDTLWGLFGQCLVLRGPDAVLDGAVRRVAELEAATVRSSWLDVRLEERGGDGGSRVVGRISMPAPLGLGVVGAAYQQISYVFDNDVEVAQTARIADPTVGPATGGLFVNAVVHDAGGSGHTVSLDVRASWLGRPESMISGAKHISAMERVPQRTLTGAGRLVIPTNGSDELVLGRGPTGRAIVAVVTVSR